MLQRRRGCDKRLEAQAVTLTDCWDSSNDLSELELVQDCRFTSGVETNHEDSHVLLAKEAGH